MKPIQKKRGVMVGLFIFLGLVILVIGILTLGGQRKMFEKTFRLNAIFTDVAGLQRGNNIWHSGIKIGTAKNITLCRDGMVEVEMRIKKKYHDFITKDSKVKIGSDGLIGNKLIIIYGGTPQMSPVDPGDTLKAEMSLSSAEMMNTLQESNKNLSLITSDLKKASRNLAEGKGTLGELFTHDTLANQLKATATTMQLASENIQLLTSNLAKYSFKMQREGVLANDVASDTVFFSRLRAAAIQIEEASENAKQLTDNLNQVSYKIRDSSNLAGVVFQDQETADNLRETAENLKLGTKKFEENMEALKHNFLFRGYFRKKERQRQIEEERAQAKAKKGN
jgi:phospholipid/cholesterol/gamma-HCH transport system substrate-binding protein